MRRAKKGIEKYIDRREREEKGKRSELVNEVKLSE